MKSLGKHSTWLQMLFWGGTLSLLPMLVNPNSGHGGGGIPRSMWHLLVTSGVVYVNLEYLLPRYYLKKKRLQYYIGAIILLLGAMWVLVESLPFPPDWFRDNMHGESSILNELRRSKAFRVIPRSMPVFLSLIGSSFYAIGKYSSEQAKDHIRLQNEKLSAELKFLKSQINPHFLFNALHNIYALSVLQSEKTPENLLKLSHLLRYMLYDASAETVRLGQEIDYLRDFLALAQLKDSEGLNIQVELDESQATLQIAPLLFLPLIENAFKHSHVENLKQGWIRIRLETGEKWVRFQVSNSLPSKSYTKDAQGGIGLENIQRQLELIYPGKHQLKISRETDQFTALLYLDLT